MIPNLIKGSGITGAIRYNMGEGNEKGSKVRKELAPGAVSRSQILGGQGFGFEVDSAERVELARRVMEFNGQPENQRGRTKKCKLDCLHLSLSWEAGQKPTPGDMTAAARSALKALGMEKAQAVFFAHHDTAHPHVHIVASRINPATGKAFADTRDKIAAQAWGLQWEREHKQVSPARLEMHRLVEAVKTGNRVGLVDLMTLRKPTFTSGDLDRVLAYAGLDKVAGAKFRDEVLADYHVVGLREHADEPVMRYTTRDVLAAERRLQADALGLEQRTDYAVHVQAQRGAAGFHKLNTEQAAALRHATGDEGFAIIAGQAGTGKSRVMGAIRDAYEAEGYKVIGLAWTNSVVQDMREKGYANAATITTELGLFNVAHRGPVPAAQWDNRTVLMVDEAAMLATDSLGAVAARANEAGAKLILVGDDKQLGSIERGGMFASLSDAHGAAEITEVQRVKGQDQRDAFSLMHKGQFSPALKLFEKEGALNWTEKPAEAEAALVSRYTKDVTAVPEKSRFIFAHSNEQVDRLNSLARGLAFEAGKLGADHLLPTARGPELFAAGDRIQLTGNGRSRQGKEAGFVNGATGTVTAINTVKDKSRVSIALDSGKALSFVVGEDKGEFNAIRHGYAGTIYKGQGRTIDQTYVLVSQGWRSESSYVAMTRHRESVAVFVPKEVAPNRELLAKLMGRDDQRRAATGYMVDAASMQRPAPKNMPRKVVNYPLLEEKPLPLEKQTSDKPVAKAPEKGKETVPRGTAPNQRKTADKASSAAKSGAAAPNPGRAADKVAGAVGGIMRGATKLLSAAFEVGNILEGLMTGKDAPTPEEKIEQAKEDHAADQAGAAAAKANVEQERLSDEEKLQRAVTARMAVMFPGETLEEIERRQREQDTDRGRDRGR